MRSSDVMPGARVRSGCLTVVFVAISMQGVGAASAQTPLFSRAALEEASLSPRQTQLLRLLCDEPGAGTVELVILHSAQLGVGEVVTLPLPDGTDVALVGTAVTHRAEGDVSWKGQAAPEHNATRTNAQALLVARDGAITGTLRVGAARYTIRPLTGGLHAIARTDPEAQLQHGPDYEAFEQAEALRIATERAGTPFTPGTPALAHSTASAGTSPSVDVLFVFTAAAAAAHADLAAFARLRIDTANLTFDNSGIPLQVALAGVRVTSTVESGSMQDDLYALQAVGDGRFEDVHLMRRQYGADLVALFGKGYPDITSGQGFLDASAEWAFTIVDASAGPLTFVHEIGHNFGAHHDPYVAVNPSFAHGHGYVNLAGRWRTLMAYGNRCLVNRVDCERIEYWSGPDVLYTDATEPIQSGPTGNATQSNNVRVLTERAATVAAFFPRVASPVAGLPPSLTLRATPGQVFNASLTIANLAARGSAPLDWQIAVVGAGPTADDECRPATILAQNHMTYGAVAPAGENEYGQSFTAPCTGRLVHIAPRIQPNLNIGGSWTASLQVYEGHGTIGRLLTQVDVAHTMPSQGPPYPGYSLPISLPEPLPVTRGEPLTWFADMTSGRGGFAYSVENPDPAGMLFRTSNGNPLAAVGRPAEDMYFQALFEPPPRWIRPAAASGYVNAGTSITLMLAVDARGLAEGAHPLRLLVTSNDPAAPAIYIPITLGVTLDAEPTPYSALYLDRPAPNPTSGTTTIAYSLPAPGSLRLTVIDLLGRVVAVLADGYLGAGQHQAVLAGDQLAPGLYVIRLSAAGESQSQFLTIVR